ncbi:hypothetical protein [Methylobacterium sp. J-070]|uniref:hypothetical protein n=1 Tax=Methylobacterium sp. J-070 TaxID=2836650 RepID=UPI001FBAF41E|nr:hypothetical protein [Methylobacterium sp. J-070]MCJ2052935.1 hypothetical protein [Methylobacterium sp. J-070]
MNLKDRLWVAKQHVPRVMPPAIDRNAASDLATRLEAGLTNPFSPMTLASSLKMRNIRIGLNSHLLDAFAPFADDALRTVTVIYAGWAYSPATLDTVTAAQLKRQFLQHLNRAGVSAIPGPLFAVLHGEYEPRSGIYQIHFHVVTTVAKAAAMAAGLRASKIQSYVKSASRASPVRRERVRDRIRQFFYLAKAYWPGKPVVLIDGKPKRLREHHRIPEPFATQVHLWLDRQRFADLVLLQGSWSPRNGGTPAMRSQYLFVLGAGGGCGS